MAKGFFFSSYEPNERKLSLTFNYNLRRFKVNESVIEKKGGTRALTVKVSR